MVDIEYGLEHQRGPKIQESTQWSDPIRAEEWDSCITSTKEAVSNLIPGVSQLNRRRMSRKRLRPESGRLGLAMEDAKQAIAIKLQKD